MKGQLRKINLIAAFLMLKVSMMLIYRVWDLVSAPVEKLDITYKTYILINIYICFIRRINDKLHSGTQKKI